MEEHRELVEDERRARAEHDREECHPDLARLERDGEPAGDEAHYEARHEVVDVHVADVGAAPAPNPSHPRVETRPHERKHERQQHQERRLAAAAVDVGFVPGKEAKKVHGRGWDRTSDPSRVKRVLSR